jgi:hypothetical protein
MKSRRDLFEEQLRDLQRDISSLSNKLSSPNNTSVSSQSIKNSLDINKIGISFDYLNIQKNNKETPSFEEKQNQQSASEVSISYQSFLFEFILN